MSEPLIETGPFDNMFLHRAGSRLTSVVRPATDDDIDRLTELDLMMFEGAYGMEAPPSSEVSEMLGRRLANVSMGGGLMLVCEVEGEVNGFGTYFKTDKPWEQFTTWEESTNDGTLDGVVDLNGRYAYVPNMTVAPKASAVRGMQKIMVNLIAGAIEDNVEYAYFVSRIPEFTKWLASNGHDYTVMEESELDLLAEQYIGLERTSSRGKVESFDYELRTYDRAGFSKGKLVKGGFSDGESLSYGVTYKAPIPLTDKPLAVRKAAARILRMASRSTKLMSKI